MSLPRLACLAAVVGGGCWVAAYLLTLRDGAEAQPALFWAGAALLTVMGALAGASSVRRGPALLKLLVALCAPVAGWMILLACYQLADSTDLGRELLDAVVGAIAILGGLLGWRSSARRSSDREESRAGGRGGAHR